MREIKLGLLNGSVKLYDSVKELNIERDHEQKKLFLQDAEIGSDMDGVAKRFTNINHFLVNGRVQEAIQENKNLHNNLFYQIEGIDINSFCFAAMVHSVNGKEVKTKDLQSIDYVQELIKELSKKGLKASQCKDIVEDVKKNFKKSFNPTFLISSETQE